MSQTVRLLADPDLSSPKIYFWDDGTALGDANGYALTETGDGSGNGIGYYKLTGLDENLRILGKEAELRDSTGHIGIGHVAEIGLKLWVIDTPQGTAVSEAY